MAMNSFFTWLRYLNQKADYSVALANKSYEQGRMMNRQLVDAAFRSFFLSRMTHTVLWIPGEEMAPTISGPQQNLLLLRKIPQPNLRCVSVGDVVLLKDPFKKNMYLVRRLAAIEGYEMVSKDEKDQLFVLDKDECWVLADNKNLKPQEAIDSRIFGPVPMTDIIARVVYCLRTASDHGPVQNSQLSMQMDSPVLKVELDVAEMVKQHKP